MEKYFYLTNKNANVILLSDFTKEDFLKSVPFKGKAFVLNNFVADEYFNVPEKNYDAAKKELRLVAAGTLKPLKNHVYLLEIFKLLKDHNISLDIYGEGEQTEFENIISNAGIKVRLMGHTNRFDKVIGQYDLFIMPSLFEGFPLSVFEAMAAGVPLMISDIEPLTSIVKDHAIYFELDGAPKVAEQILSVYHGQTGINDMAAAAKQYAEKTVRREIYIDKLLKIYEEISK